MIMDKIKWLTNHFSKSFQLKIWAILSLIYLEIISALNNLATVYKINKLRDLLYIRANLIIEQEYKEDNSKIKMIFLEVVPQLD